MVVPGLQVIVVSPAQATPGCPGSAASTAAAQTAARGCDGRVEDLSMRSETTQVFANPNGGFTAEQYAAPVRARRADGSWAAIDLTLRRNVDGTVSPTVTTTPLTLSGGGTGPLATVTARPDQDRFAMSWPGKLPRPTLAGDTATYPNVLPGVDLQIRAQRDGFAQALVVRTREAAANPALKKIKFTTAGADLGAAAAAASAKAAPGVRAGAAGATSYQVSASAMWDSAKADDPSLGDERSDVAGPALGARRAPVTMEVAGADLYVLPDPELLTSTETALPLYIDPSVATGSAHWTMINSKHADQQYWTYDRSSNAKTGYVVDAVTGVQMYRSMWDFSTNDWRGRHVTKAQFYVDLLHSYSCTASNSELHQTGGINSGTTWNTNAGSWGATLANASNSSCKDVATTTEFAGQGVTNVVSATANDATVTLGLRSTNETSNGGWKKWNENSAKLVVEFNSVPNTPDTLQIDGKPCGTGASAPFISTVGGHQPVITARLSDADPANQLNANFEWGANTGVDTGWARAPGIANGATAWATITTNLTPGTTYAFRANADDGLDTSAFSGWCEFQVDNAAPAVAPKVESADGRYALPGCDGRLGWCDGVGKVGSFTFGANGIADVTGYLYGFTSTPTSTVAAQALGGSATIAFTPMSPGITDLYVRSVDRAGNLGPVVDYRFFVGSGAPPVSLWSLGDGSGATAADTGSADHPLALTGNVGWSAGRIVGTSAGAFNGSTAFGTVSGPVVDTSRSFTMSSWVRLTDASDYRAVLSMAGVNQDSFFLYYDKGSNRWGVQARDNDNQGTIGGPYALSTTTPQLNRWVHLTASYDATAGQMRLYVNGVREATVAARGWQATGQTQVGRRLQQGNFCQYWSGDLSDVRVWDRLVDDAEIAALAAPTLVGSWRFDEGEGTVGADRSPGHHDMALTDATWTSPGHRDDYSTVTLNGTSAYGASAPVVRTDQSLTMSVWVRLSSGDGWPVALSLPGTNASSFFLYHDKGTGKWGFQTRNTDTPTEIYGAYALSTNNVQVGQWTHLVGVYDAAAGQIRLYVNGTLNATVPYTSAWMGTGAVEIGRARAGGGSNGYWPGDIDNVRIYQGVLSAVDIQALANS